MDCLLFHGDPEASELKACLARLHGNGRTQSSTEALALCSAYVDGDLVWDGGGGGDTFSPESPLIVL